MEESQMSEVSGMSALSEVSKDASQSEDDKRHTIMVALSCFLLILLIMLLLLFLSEIFSRASEESEASKNTDLSVYLKVGGGVKKSSPPATPNSATATSGRTTARQTTVRSTDRGQGMKRSTTSWSSDFKRPSSRSSHSSSQLPGRTPPPPKVTIPSSKATSKATKETTTSKATTTSKPTTTISTTTEDSWHYSQDYKLPIWTYLHKYLCPFWADKQGFRSHRRTYGIALFPYMFCHYAMYCCYTLDNKMQLQPELPEVDLPPRDAVRRMANFKVENPHLKVWLVIRGPDSVFLKLLKNANNEKATFQKNALAWMKANNYDAIRMWWNNAPDSLNRSMAELYNHTNDVFMPHNNRTFGFVFPYGSYTRASYNTSKLAHRRAYHTIVLYHEYPRDLTDKTVTTYTIREMRVYSRMLNQTDRPAFCHLYPFVALTYKIDPAKCVNGSGSKPYRIKPLGYGPPGPLTKTAGILSLPELCDILDSSWNQTLVYADEGYFHPDYHFACKGEDAIAFTDREDVFYSVRALDSEFEEEVFGVMNPEYDDFPGVCPPPVGNNRNFPTVQAVFQLMVH